MRGIAEIISSGLRFGVTGEGGAFMAEGRRQKAEMLLLSAFAIGH